MFFTDTFYDGLFVVASYVLMDGRSVSWRSRLIICYVLCRWNEGHLISNVTLAVHWASNIYFNGKISDLLIPSIYQQCISHRDEKPFLIIRQQFSDFTQKYWDLVQLSRKDQSLFYTPPNANIHLHYLVIDVWLCDSYKSSVKIKGAELKHTSFCHTLILR